MYLTWLLMVACGGQSNECDKASRYLGWMDEDGTTEASRDCEDEPDCDSKVEAQATLETCIDECDWNESDAYQACDDDCRDAAQIDVVHFDGDGYQLCRQDCDDQPTWECPE